MAKKLNEHSFRKFYSQGIAAHSMQDMSIYHFIVETCDASSDRKHEMMDYFQRLNQDCRRQLLRFLHEQDKTEYLLHILSKVNFTITH